MTSKRFFRAAALFLFFLTALSVLGQSSQALPDAPSPNSGLPPVHASGSDTYAPSKWYGVVDPGEKIPPLHPRDKMMFWVHEDARPVGWIPAILVSGWSQLVNGDPDYGSDSAAFGERIGAAVLRDTSMRFFSDSLLPTATHEDPRYFRKAYGGIKARAAYAAEEVFVGRRDDGTSGFNYSNVLGHLAGAALTPTYYPARSANGRVVATTWSISLAGAAGGNLFLEFWPDVRDAVFLKKHRQP
jgi:hypothetical protein